MTDYPTPRDIIYQMLDEARRDGELQLSGVLDVFDFIRSRLDKRQLDLFGFWTHGHSEAELTDIVDDWFVERRIGEHP